MLNDQNSAGSLILSVERCVAYSATLFRTRQNYSIFVRAGSLNFDSRKQTAWKKAPDQAGVQGKGSLYTVYIIYSFIYSR